jgi:hypothetical protein
MIRRSHEVIGAGMDGFATGDWRIVVERRGNMIAEEVSY